jgi:hypothetical protein
MKNIIIHTLTFICWAIILITIYGTFRENYDLKKEAITRGFADYITNDKGYKEIKWKDGY